MCAKRLKWLGLGLIIPFLIAAVSTGPGGSGNKLAGTNVVYTSPASLNDVLFFDGTNWNVGPVVASSTNATFGSKTNGTTVTAAASAINFVYGSNVVIRTTNSSGQVDIQISAQVPATNAVLSAPDIFDGASVEGDFEVIGGGNIIANAGLITPNLVIRSTNGTSRIVFDVNNEMGTNRFHFNVDPNSLDDDQVLVFHSTDDSATGSDITLTNRTIDHFDPNYLTIYVATNGNDATAIPGNPSKPFRTIASAASNVVNNSVVLVGPGEFTYVPTIQTNVVLDAPLNTSIGFDLKTNVAVIGSGPGTVFTSGTNWGEFINVRSSRHVLFENFTVQDRQLTGPEHGTFGLTNLNWSSVRFIGTNQHITIRGVKFIDHTRQCIDHLYGPIRTTHVLVDNCWFENGGVTNVPGAVTHDGAAFVGIGTDWTMQNCVVTNYFRAVEPIHVRTPADTVQHSGVRLINNKFLGIWENAITTLSPYKDMLIENNLITRLNPTTESEGYALKLAGGGSEFTIRGNTIIGWNHAIYSETSETNMVIEANRFINNGVGITLYVASGDGRKSTGHIVRNNFFQDISGPAIQIGGVNNAIIGNQFLNCKTNTTAGQGVVRMVNPTTNLVIRGNWYRSFQSIDTNAFCISLTGIGHRIQDEIFQDYKTAIYTGTAVGTTFDFNGIAVNSALAPTDGDVLTYDSATGVYTNLAAAVGAGNPAGADTQIQFNDGGSFGGLSNLMYYKASGTIIFSNNIGDGFVDFAAPVTFKSAITNEGPIYQLFPSIGGSDLIYRQPDGLLTTWSSIYDMVHTNATSTNFITGVADIGTPASGDLIPIVDVSTAARKYVSIANLPAGSGGDTNFVVTTTDNAFITNLFVTGTGPGSIILSNSTGSEFVELIMSDAGTSATNALSWSTITPGELVGFHDANGTLTNVAIGSVAAVGGSGAIQFAQGADLAGTNGTVKFLFDRTNSAVRLLSSSTAYIEVGNSTTGTNRVYGDQFFAGNDLKLTAQGAFWALGASTGSLTPSGATNDIGASASRVRTNWVGTVNAAGLVSSNSAYRFTVDTNGPTGIASREHVTNIVNALSSSYTPLLSTNVTASGTNFHINVGVAPANDTTFELNLAANSGVTIGGGTHRQIITVALLQDTTGNRTVALTNLFHFGNDLPSPLTLSTNGGWEDLTRWQYHSSSNKWYHLGAIRGFGP